MTVNKKYTSPMIPSSTGALAAAAIVALALVSSADTVSAFLTPGRPVCGARSSAFASPPTTSTISTILYESPPETAMETTTGVTTIAVKEEEEGVAALAEPSTGTEESQVAKPVKKAAVPANKHKEGVFSPLVIFVKEVVGDAQLNKLRGKAISVHSDVIGSFVDTAETAFGDAVLRALFRLADINKDGTISKDELQTAVKSLGFSWLQDKQVEGIFKRADADSNGEIDMDEWVREAPKTLRTNLIKLAKKNGGDMGLLS